MPHTDLHERIRALVPDAQSGRDYALVSLDSQSADIQSWTHASAAQPTEAALMEVGQTAIDAAKAKATAQSGLRATDALMPHHLEELVQTLITKGTIVLTDLPDDVQTTFTTRRTQRALVTPVVEE